MRRLKTIALLLVTLALAVPAVGEPSDFYLGLLRRGMADYDAGRYEQSLRPLRIAAFGLMDSVPQYETAQVYIALASDKLKRETDTRNAIQRILTAERIEKTYGSLSITGATRAAFEIIAKKLLTSVDYERLHGGSGYTGAPPEVTGSQRSLNDPHDHRSEQPVPQPEGPQPLTPSQPPPPSRPSTAAPTTPAPARPTPAPASPTPAPRSAPTQPVPVPRTTQPAPVPSSTPAAQPAPRTATAQPAPQTPAPQPQLQPQPPSQASAAKPRPLPAPAPAPAPATLPAPTVERRLSDADAALVRNDLPTARTIYRDLLDNGTFDHAGYVRLAEGLYRARAFSDSLRAFERSGGLRSGEEPYHFYMAVALYETGRYDDAKRELAAALPYIEVTPDVARYRAKIEGAID